MNISMATQQPGGASSPPLGPSRRGLGWHLVGIFADSQTWLDILYLLLSFPVGLTAFVVLVVLLSTGGMLAVTLVGIPILVGAMYFWCEAADIDRATTNVLLGTRIPPLPFEDTMGDRLWRWSTIRLRLANPFTWRSLAYLFLRMPQGVIAFTSVMIFIVGSLGAVALPFYYQYGDSAPYYAVGRRADTLPEALVVSAVGVVTLVLGAHILRALARLSGTWATLVLAGGRTIEYVELAPDAREGDAFDVLTWRGLRLTGAMDAHGARLQTSQLRFFAGHLIFMASIVIMLAVINAAAGHGPWSVWPVWGLSIPVAIHAGYLLRGWIGAHAAAFAAVNLGLFVIDLNYSDTTWFFWPLLAWTPVLAACAFGSWRLRRAAARSASIGAYVSHTPQAISSSANQQPGINVDLEMRRVTVDGREVDLTPKEFELLVLLHENPGRPFNRGELLDRIWRNEYEVTDRTVDACVMRLRRKLGHKSQSIQTVWGVGYRYTP